MFEVLSLIAAVLLTLVGYSSGASGAGRVKGAVPRIADLVFVTAVIVGVLVLRPELGKWWALLLGVVLGALAGIFTIPFRPPEDAAPEPVSAAGDQDVGRMQARWQSFLLEMGNFQGRMIMAFFYFFLVTPFAALSRLGSNPLDPDRDTDTLWMERSPSASTLDEIRKQS